jgi:tRNA dimethylallyltransferase
MDILSARPAPDLLARVAHHLIGEVPSAAPFDVAQWLARARACIDAIRRRGHLPIVCGGTGLYIRALTRGLADAPGADPGIRAMLEKEPLPALVERLRALDPATTVDMKNPRRVIRALEVCLLTGRPFSGFLTQWEKAPATPGVVLSRDRDELHARIDARTLAMFEAGVVEEVARAGESIGPTAAQVLGLREIRSLLAGHITREACIAAIQQATRNYARRQLTWFRKETGLPWLNLTGTTATAALLHEHFTASIGAR